MADVESEFTVLSFFFCICTCIVVCQVIPGLSPSKPNRLLQTCMSQSGPINNAPVYNNQPANSVNVWCRSYSKALPCVTKYLPTASLSNPNDWYLNLVFDEEYADKSSKSLCSRLKKYGNKMGCLTRDMNQAEMCVRMLTSPIAEHIHKIYQLNQTVDTETNENSLRACLIPIAASRCFKPFFKSCRKGIRKLMARYFMILSGKCLKIAKEHEKLTTPKSVDIQDDTMVDQLITEKDDKETTTLREDEENQQSTEIMTNADGSDGQTRQSNEEDQHTTEGTSNADSSDDQMMGINDESGNTSHQDETISSQPYIQDNRRISPTTATANDMRPTTAYQNIVNMHIIQRVVESDSETESEHALQKVEHGTFVHSRRIITVNERFIKRKNKINIRQMTTIRPKEIAEDIYIPDTHILSAMKPLPEKEIIHPDEEKEVESILSTFDNVTTVESSSSSSEEEASDDEPDLPIVTSTETIMPSTSRTFITTVTMKTTKRPRIQQTRRGSQKGGGSKGVTIEYNMFVLVGLTFLSLKIKIFKI